MIKGVAFIWARRIIDVFVVYNTVYASNDIYTLDYDNAPDCKQKMDASLQQSS